jgi:hypothetical protein
MRAIEAKTFSGYGGLRQIRKAGEALRHPIEDRPFGKVVLAG